MKNPRVRRAVKKGRKKQIFAAAHLRGEGGVATQQPMAHIKSMFCRVKDIVYVFERKKRRTTKRKAFSLFKD